MGEAFERLRRGELRGSELLAWLAGRPPHERDRALEALLGIEAPDHAGAPPGPDLIGYIPSGVAAIVRSVFEAPLGVDDVLVDIGSGLGKVAMTAHLLTGARAIGIELEPTLARRAQASARALGLAQVELVAGDARDADLACGSVFYMYLPFTGSVLADVMRRLREIADRRAIVVCALGLDLGAYSWLVARQLDSFWLSVYDSRCPAAPPRTPRVAGIDATLARIVAAEAPLPSGSPA